jgi:hypothetical protein
VELSESEGLVSESVRLENGKTIPVIDMSFKMQAFPVFVSMAPTWIYFAHLVVFWFHDRMAGYLPTISETGTDSFSHKLQYKSFPVVGPTTVFTEIVIAMCTFTQFPHARLGRNLARICMVVGGFCMCVTGMAQLHLHQICHQSTAFSGLFFVVVFQVVVYGVCFESIPILEKLLKMCCITMEFISLVIVALAERLFPDRTCLTWSMCGEHVLLWLTEVFLLSYFKELSAFSLFLSFDE